MAMRDRLSQSSSWARGALVLAFVLTAVRPSIGHAQQPGHDDEARSYFEQGRAAFEAADYERALVYFRHAYRLSPRPELQYNIGVAADRLQREEEALVAFEQYLSETQEPVREAEVRERIEALQQSLEEREATARALSEAKMRYEAAETTVPATDRARMPTSTIAGGATLAAAGAAGVVAMAVGLSRDGSCKDERGGVCVTQNAATPWTYAYGALGLAALAGSATWFGVSYRRTKRQRETIVTLTPTAIYVSKEF